MKVIKPFRFFQHAHRTTMDNDPVKAAVRRRPLAVTARARVSMLMARRGAHHVLTVLLFSLLVFVPVVGFAFDTDGDGVTNFLDLDDDNDGIPDTVEGCYILPTISSTSSPDAVVFNPTQMLDGFTDPITSASNHRDNGSFTIVDLGRQVPAGTGVKLVYQGAFGFEGTIEVHKWNNFDSLLVLPALISDSIDVDPVNFTNDTIDGPIVTSTGTLLEITQYLRVYVTETGGNGRVDVDFLGVDDQFVVGPDKDGDGVVNCIDLDVDGDGITDNVEAQTTAGYIAPGTFVDTGAAPGSDVGDGINDVYGSGLIPVNTDGTGPRDYKDTDSDDDGFPDIGENNLLLAVSGTDADGDGIDANHDSDDATWGSVNNGMDSPSTDLPNSDSAGDVNYRDTNGGALACEPEGYMVRGQGSAWTTLDLVEGTVVNADDNFATQINGIGYNPTDNAIWGYENGPTLNGGRDGQLTRTVKAANGVDWVTTLTAVIANLPETSYPVGDVSDTGVLHLYSNGKIQKVDVNPASGTYLTRLGEVTLTNNFTFPASAVVTSDALGGPCTGVTPDAGVVFWDYAFHPDFPDLLFAVSVDGTCKNPYYAAPQLYSIDVTSGLLNHLGDAGIDPPNTINAVGGLTNAGLFGAAFFTADGFLYISDNKEENDDDGDGILDSTVGEADAPIFRIDLSGESIPLDYDQTKSVKFSEGPASGGKNDGAMCRGALINIDLGDAPATYGTTLAQDGPRHEMTGYDPLNDTNDLMLGSNVDREPDSLGADSYDDGITWPASLTQNSAYAETVTVVNTTGDDAYINAWIDFNGDGDFDDPGEHITDDQVVADGDTTASLSFTVPLLATLGDYYARIRICDSASDCDSPLGPAVNGEVEDYPVTLGPVNACDATASGNLDTDGDGVSNICDFDSDNDGILDAAECTTINASNTTYGALSLQPSSVSITSGPTVNTNGQNSVPVNDLADFPLLINKLLVGNGSNGSYDDFLGSNNKDVPEVGDIWDNDDLTLRFTYSSAVFARGFRIWNDFGSAPNNHTALYDIIAYDASNNVLETVSNTTVAEGTNGEGIGDSFQEIEFSNILGDIKYFEIVVKQVRASANDWQFREIALYRCPDTDGDGIDDYLDLDSDNDGILDLVEAGHTATDSDGDGRIDVGGTVTVGADGVLDALQTVADDEGVNYNINTTGNGDSDSVLNFRDLDSDDDGIPDNVEAQSSSGYIAPVIADSDGDGIIDVYDDWNSLTCPGAGTCISSGLTPQNSDSVLGSYGDAIPDYLDTDSDQDGRSDNEEGPNTALSGNDADGDGLDDAFDTTNTGTFDADGRPDGWGNGSDVTNNDVADPLTDTGTTPDGDGDDNDCGAGCTAEPLEVDRDYRDLGADFGDAPASYGTWILPLMDGDPGPIHLIANTANPTVNNLYLGSSLDRESPSAALGTDADLDDSNSDDEDGVTFSARGAGLNNTIEATVSYTKLATDSTIWAWMAVVDGSGTPATKFTSATANERTGVTSVGAAGTFTHVFTFNVPQVAGSTYFRFRICSTSADCDTPGGLAPDGEVEDYKVNFDFRPTAVAIGEVALEGVAVSAFLDGIGAGQMDAAALLTAWDVDLTQRYLNASREELFQALADYLDPDGDGVVAVLRWDTLEQRGTVGFFVERQQGDGDWVRINGRMLPALIAAPMGAEYRLADPAAAPGTSYRYRLIEQEATGSTRSYGPYNVEMPH